MSVGDIIVTLLLGWVAIDLERWSVWLAPKLAQWAARVKHRDDKERAETRAREWVSVIAERPVSLLKLATALGFAGAAITVRSRVAVRRRRRRWARFVSPRPTEPLFAFSIPGVLSVSFNLNDVAMFALGFGMLAIWAVSWTWVRNRELQRLLPKLIAENVVSSKEADLVLTLFPVQWWRLGARRGAGRPIRSAADALKAALLAVATERAFQATFKGSDGGHRVLVTKALTARLQEAAEARSWLAEALADPGRSE